jgi:serine/threonine protein kinase
MVNTIAVVNLLEKLAEQINQKNYIVFVGSNFPTSAKDPLGPPGSSLLALELALRLGGHFEDYSLPWIAQYYMDRFDANKLHQFIVDRLDTAHYHPNPIHHLLVQLPINQVVYTAQDRLMREAFNVNKVPVNFVLESDESLSQAADRLLIQPFGSVSHPGSLKLTADERRTTFTKRPALAQYLQTQMYTRHSLFIGFSQGDPDFREFYQSLRPTVNNYLPLSRIVQTNTTQDDIKYWSERNAEIVQMEPLSLLQQLAGTLGILASFETSEETLPFSTEERTRREAILLDFSRQLGLGSPVESGAQLRPIANGLATLRQALSDHRKSGTIMSNEETSNQDLDARLILQEGNVEWAEGNFNSARESFEEAIRRDPDMIDAYVSLHHLLVETGESKQAVDVYQQFVQRDPTRAFIPPRYELLDILGNANAGNSYQCHDKNQNKVVVVTILRRELARKTDDLKRFENEGRSLDHPQICRFVELGNFHARNYVVTEYVKAQSLREYLNNTPVEDRKISQIFDIVNQIYDVLIFGEAKGIPHLDLRPENVLMTDQGVVLSNYGFSRLAHIIRLSSRAMDRQRTDYEAPEQRADELGDQRSDIYALGTIIYEMLTGRTPGMGVYRTVTEVHPQAEESLDVMIDHARAFDPAKRFQTIAEMKVETQRITLTTEYRRIVGQYTRIILAGLSKIYQSFGSRRGIWMSIIAILLLLYTGWSDIIPSGWFKSGVRTLALFFISSLITSAMGHSMVREFGRVRGLGSLIASGRGIGASLGVVICAFIIHTTDWGTTGGIPGVDGVSFLGYVVVNLAVGLMMAFGGLVLLNSTGWIFEKRWQHYTQGFYLMFLFLFFVLFVVSVLNPPIFYIIRP